MPVFSVVAARRLSRPGRPSSRGGGFVVVLVALVMVDEFIVAAVNWPNVWSTLLPRICFLVCVFVLACSPNLCMY